MDPILPDRRPLHDADRNWLTPGDFREQLEGFYQSLGEPMRVRKKTSHGRPLLNRTAKVHEVIWRGGGYHQLQGMSDKVAISTLASSRVIV
jgi:hypothetical protein